MAEIDTKGKQPATCSIVSEANNSSQRQKENVTYPRRPVTPAELLGLKKPSAAGRSQGHLLPISEHMGVHEPVDFVSEADISFLDLNAPSSQPEEVLPASGSVATKNIKPEARPYTPLPHSPPVFPQKVAPEPLAEIRGHIQLDYVNQELDRHAAALREKALTKIRLEARRRAEKSPANQSMAVIDDADDEEEENESSELGEPTRSILLSPSALIDNKEVMGLRGGALDEPSWNYGDSADSSDNRPRYLAPTLSRLNKSLRAGPGARLGNKFFAAKIPHQLRALHSSVRRNPSGKQLSGQTKHRMNTPVGGESPGGLRSKGTVPALLTVVADGSRIPSTLMKSGRLTADSKSSSPFQHVPVDEDASVCNQALLKTPLKQRDVQGLPHTTLEELAASIERTSMDHSGLQTPTPNDWAPWGVADEAEDKGAQILAALMRSPKRQSMTDLDLLFQGLGVELRPPNLNAELAGDHQQQTLAATADVIAPRDSADESSFLTKKPLTTNNSISIKKTRPQGDKKAAFTMADTNAAPKSEMKGRGSVGPSPLHRRPTQAEFPAQTLSPNNSNSRSTMKRSSINQPTQSTLAKQREQASKHHSPPNTLAKQPVVMPQLSTSQRKYNPRSSLGGFTGHLRAPASLPTVAMSDVTAIPSGRTIDMDTQAFYNLLWPGQGYMPAQNNEGQLYLDQQPLARIEKYLRQRGISAKQAFVEQFGGAWEFRYADFTAAWDMVDAKYGKPEDDDVDQARPLPVFPAPAAKKTHAQHIVSGFKKSISKSGLSNLTKMPSRMSLPLNDNQIARSSSGPAALEHSKPSSRPQSPSEIFEQNPRFADDDPRCVAEAKSERYWAARYNTLKEQRMNDPEEFQESIKLAVELSKKPANGRDREDYQQQWDARWDEKEVGRALDVFNELYDLCKTAEARRSLKDYKIYLAREKGWHVLLPAGVPMKEPPTSGMSKVAGKMMGKGDTSIRQMQLEWKEQRAADKTAASLGKKQPFKPRRSILGMHQNGIPSYDGGVSGYQKSQIPLPKGGSPQGPRVYTPMGSRILPALSSSPGQPVGSGSGGRNWLGRKKPVQGSDGTPKPAQVGAKAAMKENVRRK